MNEKENTEIIDNRYYCIECAENRKKEKERNKNGWEELFEYICELYNIDTLTGMMFKQIKDFRENYNYKNKGMYLTLKYYYETLENEIKEDTGLGIIPYYYERAKQYFLEKQEIIKHTEEFKSHESINTVKIKIHKDIKDYEKIKQLSFESTTHHLEPSDS